MTTKNYALITAIVFTIVALAHIWRLYTGAEVTMNGTAVPMAGSWVGLIIAGILAVCGFRLASRS
jgi:hypothetical protein